MTRVASGVWVSAYLRRLEIEFIPGYVTRRGDGTAGAVLVKCATLDGRATVHERIVDLMTGRRRWDEVSEGPETEIDALIGRKMERDPDLWVVEIESRDGRTLLGDPGLAD